MALLPFHRWEKWIWARERTPATLTSGWGKLSPALLRFPTQATRTRRQSPSGSGPWRETRGRGGSWALAGLGTLRTCVSIVVRFFILPKCRAWAQKAFEDKVSSLILKWPARLVTGSGSMWLWVQARGGCPPPRLLSQWGVPYYDSEEMKDDKSSCGFLFL